MHVHQQRGLVCLPNELLALYIAAVCATYPASCRCVLAIVILSHSTLKLLHCKLLSISGSARWHCLLQLTVNVVPKLSLAVALPDPTTAAVTPNGMLSLGSILSWSFPYPSSPLPKKPLLGDADKDIPYRDTIYPFWSDLVTRTNGVAFATVGDTVGSRRFLVTWDDAYVYNYASSHLFISVVFYEAETYVDVVYGPFENGNVPTTVYDPALPAGPAQPPVTIAVQNIEGNEATQSSFFNVGGLTAYAKKAIRFSRVAPTCPL